MDVREWFVYNVPITNSFMHKLSGNRAINTAANGPYDATFRSTDLANPCDLLSNELFLLHMSVTAAQWQ